MPSLNVAVRSLARGTFMAPSAGLRVRIAGGVTSGWPVVKFHVVSSPIPVKEWPDKSSTAVAPMRTA